LQINPSTLLVNKISKANETLHARAQIAEYRYKGFRETLKNEKKKRKRGKRLNSKGEVSTETQIWGSKEATNARAHQDQKDTPEEQERIDKYSYAFTAVKWDANYTVHTEPTKKYYDRLYNSSFL
jgi:hypothetical protein